MSANCDDVLPVVEEKERKKGFKIAFGCWMLLNLDVVFPYQIHENTSFQMPPKLGSAMYVFRNIECLKIKYIFGFFKRSIVVCRDVDTQLN